MVTRGTTVAEDAEPRNHNVHYHPVSDVWVGWACGRGWKSRTTAQRPWKDDPLGHQAPGRAPQGRPPLLARPP